MLMEDCLARLKLVVKNAKDEALSVDAPLTDLTRLR